MNADPTAAAPLLAIDVGGTTTRAVVLDRTGTCLGFGSAGAGNPTSATPDGAASEIIDAAACAAAESGIDLGAVSTAVAGIAGAAGRRGDVLRDTLRRAAFPADLELAADLLATFRSGTLANDGYAIVVGTGAIAGRIEGGHLAAICDGAGWLLGDEGSGFWIGRRVATTVVAALDGRRAPTALTAALLDELGVARDPDIAAGENGRRGDLVALLEHVYAVRPVELARFARLAFNAAAAGDAAATEIVDAAAAALAVTAAAIAGRGVNGPLVLGGSILANQSTMADRVVAAMRAAGIDGPVTTVTDGLIGAAVLALERSGVAVDDDSFTRIRTTLSALR